MRLLDPMNRGTAPRASATVLSFDATIQDLGPLQEAAYRLLGTATVQVEREEKRWICRLEPSATCSLDTNELGQRFLDLVTDENLRAKVGRETEGVRNLILALAFGALAQDDAGAGISANRDSLG